MSVRPYRPEQNKWLIDIRLGRKKRYYEVFQGTYDEAVIYEQELKKHLSKKEQKTTRTISDIAFEYLDYVKIHQSEKTFKNKQRMILKHLIPFFGNFTFELVNQKLLDAYKIKRLREIQDKGINGYRELNLELLCLSNMSRFAFERGYCSEMLKNIHKLPYRRKLPEPLDIETALKFLDVAKTEPFYYALFLCLYKSITKKATVF